MDSITLQNYRCFGSEEQTARLAPLTLLVGPNSTGKTSFLALIRALWDVAFREVAPNFREEPFDLGSFGEIVHRDSRRSIPPDSFASGFEYANWTTQPPTTVNFHATFGRIDVFPFPVVRTVAQGEEEFAIDSMEPGVDFVQYRSGEFMERRPWPGGSGGRLNLIPFWAFADVPFRLGDAERRDRNVNLDLTELEPLVGQFVAAKQRLTRPFAGSPVRSRPQRTYDPMRIFQDPEGNHIPTYLASVARRGADGWHALKCRLEAFGSASGLFDEINVRTFGVSEGDPFQIQVRKHRGSKSRRRKGPWQNVVDVGYGISQALPILTELLRPDGSTMFLLQQPEVHLHPQAQAALGSLFCRVAAEGRQLVVETHSDYIIDRVRMDVRDGTTGLKPEDVSILYFEPGDLDVKIHSIRIDSSGNVLDAPLSYGNFFMDEVSRSIGLRKG